MNDQSRKEIPDPKQKAGEGKKIPVRSGRKKALLAAGLILILAGGTGLLFSAAPREENRKIPLFPYRITADSDYRVHMKPNALFPKEWLEEGMLYSVLLTDFVEISFQAEAAAGRDTELEGSYTVTAAVEGYQFKSEVKKIIYQRKDILKKGQLQKKTGKAGVMKEIIRIRPGDYKQYAENAETILGGNAFRDLTVSFDGFFVIEGEEKPFSHTISIPIGSESFYEITGSDPVSEKGKISRTETVRPLPEAERLLPYLALLAAGLAAVVFTLFFTSLPDERDLWDGNMRRILRKYGSRMIALEKLPEAGSRPVLKLKDIESAVALAEELREPVLYVSGADGLPEEGRFCVSAGNYLYLLELPKP